MTISIISHPDCALHEMGAHHPESPARLTAIQDQLLATGLGLVLQHHDAPLATREQLCRVHDAEYVEQIFLRSPSEGQLWLDPDTSMNPHSLSAALHAAGAVVLGVELVMNGEASAVFCNVRPPGHHAEHDRAMGF
jgi:acetoin utilization deacetylase AcuC-like enzyme